MFSKGSRRPLYILRVTAGMVIHVPDSNFITNLSCQTRNEQTLSKSLNNYSSDTSPLCTERVTELVVQQSTGVKLDLSLHAALQPFVQLP